MPNFWGFIFESLPREIVAFLGMSQVLSGNPNHINHISNSFGAGGAAL